MGSFRHLYPIPLYASPLFIAKFISYNIHVISPDDDNEDDKVLFETRKFEDKS